MMKLKGKWRDIVIPEKQVFRELQSPKRNKMVGIIGAKCGFYCSDRLIFPKNINSGSHSPKNVFFGSIFGKGEKYETVKNQRPLHKKETQKV